MDMELQYDADLDDRSMWTVWGEYTEATPGYGFGPMAESPENSDFVITDVETEDGQKVAPEIYNTHQELIMKQADGESRDWS